ncbi:MAG: SEL1-like repeat protein [Bacteroidales bacterium]|nr:SEL1-like repeat protein [Bacteroidales bacterium]
MLLKKGIILTILLLFLVRGLHAQNARGIMSAPDMMMDPAEGVYEPHLHNLNLYTFCIGQAEGFQHLVFPEEDGKRVEDRVKDLFPFAYGVSVSHLPEDPYYRTRIAVLNQLQTAVSSSGNGDVVMLYFSGHGVLARNVDVGNEYYFVTSDTRVDDPQRTAVSGAEIRSYIEQIYSKGAFVLVFVDTCHSEALFPSASEVGGRGGIAFFASSSRDSQTIENILLRSTDFTEALVDLLQGENIKGDLTINKVALVLGAPSAGNVKPRIINMNDFVLLKTIDAKRNYRHLLDRYEDYIARGREALNQGDYARSYFEFSEAHYIENRLRNEDRKSFVEDTRALNKVVSNALDKYAEDPLNIIWRRLSQINEMSIDLDPNTVDMMKLFLGSGRYFFNLGDFSKSYSFYKKAYDRGNREDAPYFMAKIAETELPGRLPESEVKRLYKEAMEHGYDVEGYAAIRNELIQKANSGDLKSQSLLGQYYYRGDTLGFKKDFEQALTWLKKASGRKDPDAIRILGHCYRDGTGVQQDSKKAYGLYKESARLGSLLAEYYLSEMLFNGYGVKENKQKAIKNLKKLSDKGNTNAMCMLGACYLNGESVPQDNLIAERYLLRSATMGYDMSQVALGYYYAFYSTPSDNEKALYWTEKSAERRNPDALNLLGVFYSEGEVVQKSDSLAFHYFSLAAKEGNADACRNIGHAYFEGKGVKPDIQLAEHWLKEAVKLDETNKPSLGRLYFRLGQAYFGAITVPQGVERDYDKAYSYFKKAEEMGTGDNLAAELEYFLGVCLDLGYGVSKDESKALAYFHKAADKGYGEAMNNIGVYYGEGIIVEKNLDKAVEWFKKADINGSRCGMHNIGEFYLENGDTLAALPYFRKGAEKGNTSSIRVLGNYYFYGYDGVTASNKEALRYYESAYNAGSRNKTLLTNLGFIYITQFADAWNAEQYDEAYRWCEKAREVDYTDALYYKGLFYLYGRVVEKDIQKYCEYASLAYEEGCNEPSLLEEIGSIYSELFNHYYNEQDYKIALGYCKKAVDSGAKDNLFWMGYMYMKGFGVDVNLNKALEYYDMAYKEADHLSSNARDALARAYYKLYSDASIPKLGGRGTVWCERAATLGNKTAKKALSRIPSR